MAGYSEEEYERSQDATLVNPPKGSADWAAQNSGANAPELKPTPNPAPGTLEAYEKAQPDNSATPGSAVAPGSVPESKDKSSDAANGDKSATPQFGNMQDVIDFLEKRKAAIHLPTKEELEKERRRKKTEGIISAIADGASAISNLIFTTQYAPNMYQQENSMTDKMRERYDRIKKERDADADRYLNYAMTIGKLKDAQEAREYQHGRDALQDQIRMSQEARAQLKADRDAAMAELKMELMAGRITQQEAAARSKETEAEYADQYWEARVDELKSRKSKNDRWKPSSGRSGGGGEKSGRHPWRDDKGVFGKPGAVIYETSEKGAREMAATHGGTYLTTPTRRVTTKPDKWGEPAMTETVTDVSTPKVTIDWN